MVKILTIGDPHFKQDNVIETDLMETELISIIEREIPDFVVILGDILHKHDKIDMLPFNRACKFIKKIHNIKVLKKIYILIGNHDRLNNDDFLTQAHPFNSFKEWEKITIVDNVIIDKVKDQTFLFCPYVPVGRFFEALKTKEYNPYEIKAFFAHQEFKGCKINKITESDADEWPEDYPILISGHIHDYEKVNNNLIYTGTPFQHSSSDSTDKSISIFEFNENMEHSRIYLKIPKKINLTMSPEEFKIYIPPEECKIKIKIKGKLSSINTLLKLEYIKNKIDKYNIKIVIIDTEIAFKNNIITTNLKKQSIKDKIIEKIENPKILNIFINLLK